MARETNVRQGFVEEPDFQRFLDELTCVGLRGFAACAYYGGMRRGELLRLRLDDIDLDRNLLTIREAKNGEGRVAPIFDGAMWRELERVVSVARRGQVKACVVRRQAYNQPRLLRGLARRGRSSGAQWLHPARLTAQCLQKPAQPWSAAGHENESARAQD